MAEKIKIKVDIDLSALENQLAAMTEKVRALQQQEARERHECGYCHGVTYDDDYGNCICCGAGRDVRTFRPRLQRLAIDSAWGSPSTDYPFFGYGSTGNF